MGASGRTLASHIARQQGQHDLARHGAKRISPKSLEWEMTSDRAQLARLVNRVPGRFVKQVDVGGGRKESYVPHDVIEQLLLYIVGPFDFEVVELIRGDVPEVPPNPQGSSKRAKDGTLALHNAVVGARCQLTTTIDGEPTRITEIGDVEDPHNWSNDGKRAKQAASDGLKRCAMRLGLALHVWAEGDYVLDKWIPVQKDEGAETSGADRGGSAPDTTSEAVEPASGGTGAAASDPPAEPKQQRTSRARTSKTKQENASAEPAAPQAPPAEDAPAATAQAPPGVAAGATSPNGHPADQAQTMEQVAAALGRSLNNCWIRLRRAAQNGELPAKPFAELATADQLKQLGGDDLKLARAWLID